MTTQPTLFEREPEEWEADAASDRLIATIVFPDAPVGEFDYEVPGGSRARLQTGARVTVPLGRGNATRVGYCIDLGVRPNDHRRLKSVRSVLDVPSLISPDVLLLAKWIAEYYLSDLGPVLETVVPSGVRSQAGTRRVTFYGLPESRPPETSLGRINDKQKAILEYLERSDRPRTAAEISQALACTTAPLKTLQKKKLIVSFSRRVSSSVGLTPAIDHEPPPHLTEDQQQALDVIRQALHAGKQETVLLFGVTGSGKTEVYLQAIEEVIRFGRQAIVLVPEISLTPQTCRRFQSRLSRVAVLHSHLTAADRYAQWQRVVRDEIDVVVGARSAVFAPVRRLGVIVIDEEHETSFKQDVAPRYHARDVARYRTELAQVPLVLGTATPSLESWYAVQQGSVQLVNLPRRVLQRPLPKVALIDMREESRRRASTGAISRPLRAAMDETLTAGGQVILLLNRRGYSSHIQCPHCGYVVRCEACDVALTHHREGEVAMCHYCDYRIATPTRCPVCGFLGIRFGGMGTQRLEVQVRHLFPGTPCLRMDADTMRKVGSHEAALDRFRRGDVRILLGTQMIAKGLDFPDVALVGVVNADMALHLQDFRSLERTFQLVTQVAGRTGRGPRGGRVIVQTYSPELPVLQAAAQHDYLTFAEQELPRRQALQYPPVTSLVRAVIRGPQEHVVREFAEHLGKQIREVAADMLPTFRILGPTVPQMGKLRGLFRQHMFLLSDDRQLLHAVLRKAVRELVTPDKVQWILDVDAQSVV